MVLSNKERLTINVTPRATENIINLMAEKKMDHHFLRIFVDGIGCSGPKYGLAFSEEPREGDVVVNSNGIRILTDSYSLVLLQGATIDFVDTPEGPDFCIDNPNETSGFACKSCSENCG